MFSASSGKLFSAILAKTAMRCKSLSDFLGGSDLNIKFLIQAELSDQLKPAQHHAACIMMTF